MNIYCPNCVAEASCIMTGPRHFLTSPGLSIHVRCPVIRERAKRKKAGDFDCPHLDEAIALALEQLRESSLE
jgi:hypothetical protein